MNDTPRNNDASQHPSDPACRSALEAWCEALTDASGPVPEEAAPEAAAHLAACPECRAEARDLAAAVDALAADAAVPTAADPARRARVMDAVDALEAERAAGRRAWSTAPVRRLTAAAAIAAALALGALMMSSPAGVDRLLARPAAVVSMVDGGPSGGLTVERDGRILRLGAGPHAFDVRVGDRLVTGSWDQAVVRLPDGGRLTIAPDTEVVIREHDDSLGRRVLFLRSGAVCADLEEPGDALAVRTPDGSTTLNHGTRFQVRYSR